MSEYLKAFADGLRPDEPLTLSEWSDKYRVLSSKSSALPGKWRTATTPYLKEPMDVLSSDPHVQRVALMFGAQLGKSEILVNFTGWQILSMPSPCLLIQPTIDMCKRFSTQRLQPLLDETPALSERVPNSKSRDSSRTMFSVEYPGGLYILTSSSSATGLRSMPARFVLADEIDAYPVDVGAKTGEGEGDPLSLAEKRTTTFGNRRKVLMTSTPTIKDFSRIEKEFLLSDRRYYFVACPICNHRQRLEWAQVRWDDDDPSTARYECRSCKKSFDETHKGRMLAEGEWRATSKGDGKTAGFQLSGLYSPPGWLSWADMVDEFLKAKGDQALLRSWTNTRLGEPYEELMSTKIDAAGLLERCENYQEGKLPNGVLVITIGVDVQGGGGSASDALHYSVWGWGEGEEAWLIKHAVIEGDPCREDVWKQLDMVIQQDWIHADGKSLKADVIACDSGGHATAEVYNWARNRKALNCIAIKGQSQRGKPPIGKPTKVDLNFKGQLLKKGALVYPVGGDVVKTTLFGRLRHNEPGPGCLHFHATTGEKYFLELTAERQQVTFRKGFAVKNWVKKPGARNEAIDTLTYAYSGLQYMISKYDRKTFWEQMQARLENNSQSRPKQPLKSRKGAKTSFINNW